MGRKTRSITDALVRAAPQPRRGTRHLGLLLMAAVAGGVVVGRLSARIGSSSSQPSAEMGVPTPTTRTGMHATAPVGVPSATAPTPHMDPRDGAAYPGFGTS